VTNIIIFVRIKKINFHLKKKIAVVIVTYNGSFWIKRNISSVLNSDYPVHIIVVDNASTDTSVALLETFPEIEIIKNTTNLGFGKANNIGIKKALQDGADYIFLLNQDTWIFNNTVTNLVAKMEQNPTFGIISPLHFSSDGVHLDSNFYTYYNRKIHTVAPDTVEVPFVNAAAWLVSNSCFKKVGLFEPLFNHYGEDRNFADRVRFHDFKIGIVEDSSICHDRTITRNFKKDLLQSKYLILISILDVNRSLFLAQLKGLKAALGLPKYFTKHYTWKQCTVLFIKLTSYYFNLFFFKLKTILAIRKKSRLGINGV
jgi:GT2 family glycosyltransferase